MRNGRLNIMVHLDIRVPKEPKGEIRVAEQIEAYNEALKIRISEAFDEYSVILLDELYDVTPKDTTKTASSWEVFHQDPWKIWITNSNQPLADYLSEGTTAHWVEPVTAKALHWIGPGGISYFSKGHMVTGVDPYFMEWNALRNTEQALDYLMDDAIDKAFDDAFINDVGVQDPQTGDSGGFGGDFSGLGGEGEI